MPRRRNPFSVPPNNPRPAVAAETVCRACYAAWEGRRCVRCGSYAREFIPAREGLACEPAAPGTPAR